MYGHHASRAYHTTGVVVQHRAEECARSGRNQVEVIVQQVDERDGGLRVDLLATKRRNGTPQQQRTSGCVLPEDGATPATVVLWLTRYSFFLLFLLGGDMPGLRRCGQAIGQ